MSIHFKKVNTLVTIQDGGRVGFQSQGVPVGGAMDEEALVCGNLLLGNRRYQAALEIATGTLELFFEEALVIALTGRGHSVTVMGTELPYNKPIQVPANTTLKFLPVNNGVWTYLTIAGDLAVPSQLGSQSTYLPAHLGGLDGRALAVGDKLEITYSNVYKISDNQQDIIFPWGLSRPRTASIIRLIKGPDFDRLTRQSKSDIETGSFTISKDSNRMGYRFQGKSLRLRDSIELISTPVTRGTVQLTNDGTLIILMADAQTIGGYPRMAQVAAVDIPQLAKKKVGETVAFTFISYDEACQLLLQREQDWNKIEVATRLKWREHAH